MDFVLLPKVSRPLWQALDQHVWPNQDPTTIVLICDDGGQLRMAGSNGHSTISLGFIVFAEDRRGDSIG
jgi:hypothetical protein